MQIPSTNANPFAAPSAAGAAAASPAVGSPSSKTADDPVQDFLNYVGKTPAEQMRDQILHSLGLTEDQVNAMNPADRAKLEQKVKELVREKVQESTEKKTGMAIDIKV
jgi:hypothetical protein